MFKKIFKSILVWSLIAVVVATGFILFVFYGYFEDRIMETIKSEANMIEAGLENIGMAYFDDYNENGKTRLTWIDADGTVLYDSKVDIGEMENHSDRNEVINAQKNGESEYIRYSATLSQKTMYYARLLDDGTVIRLSYGYDTVGGIFSGMVQPVAIGILLLVVMIYIVADRIAKAIVAPINKIDLENGKLDEEDYTELKPLLSRIKRQNILIDTKVRLLNREHENREAFRRNFTADVSHELKTPLTSILGVSEMMMNGIIKNEDIPDFAGNINKEASRLISLVNDIILISELEGNESYLQKDRVNMVELACSVKERVSVNAAKKNINVTLKFVTADGLVCEEERADELNITILGVYNMLEELLLNLCSNAIKYNKDNGCMDITISESAENIKIIVEDTGIGIPDKYKVNVFERFFRVDKRRSKEVGGTGLGLAIVKHVALFHGGSVKAEDRQGGGTRMIATLPIVKTL